LSIVPSKWGNSTWLIDHATINKKVKFGSRKKGFFYQTLLKWKKSKYPKLQKYTLLLTFNIKIMVSFSMFWHWKFGKFSGKKRSKISTRKKFFSPSKIPSFYPNKQPKQWAGCKSQLSKTSKFACPWTILIISLTSAKPRCAVLGKIWTSGLGYIHSNFSNLFYLTNCWTDVQKNTMKERCLHFDENMEELSIYWKYP
jgi:hypothetical protein